MFYPQLVFLFIIPIQTLTNLICNGDFQNYPATTLSYGSLNNTEYYDYLESNTSCWIRKSASLFGSISTTIQIKTIAVPYWPVSSKVADTVSYDKYSICQNISLRASSKYTMKYSVALDPSIANSTFSFYVNSASILSKTYNKSNYVNTQTVNFTTNTSWNYICLTPNLINYNSSFLSIFPSTTFGPVIDNVSLYLTADLVNSTTNTTNTTTNSTINSTINSTTNKNTTNTTNNSMTTNSTNTTNNSTGTNSTSNSTINSTKTNSTVNSTNTTMNSTTNSATNSTTNTTINTTTTNSKINSTTNLTTNSTNSTKTNSTNSTTTNNLTVNSTTNQTTNSSNITISTTNSSVNTTITNSTNFITNSTTNTSTNYSTNSSTNLSNINSSITNSTNLVTNSSNISINSTGNSNISSENVTNNSSGNQSTTNSMNSTNNTINNSSNSTQNTSSSNSSINQSSSTNTSIIDNSSNSSTNSSQSNSSIIIPPFIPSITQQIVQVNFKSQISSLSENIVIVSDLKIAKYGLPIGIFSYLRVQIQQNVQNNIFYYTDSIGNLCVSFLPESYYDSATFSDQLKIYIPDLPQGYTIYTFQVVVDGKNIQLVTLTQSQKKILDSASSSMQAVSKMIQKSFLVINSVSCSYFLISLLGFYNLSLMYIFLKLKTLPNFTRIFLNTLAYVFFSKGSVTGFIKDTLKIQHQINWFDFPITEKMESHKEQFIWFGVFGNSSNFMLNNFESLVLLGFLLIKFTLLKIIIKVLPEKLKQQLDVKPSKFYQHFLGQLSCFVPFFAVSSTKCLTEMGERNWNGQLNNFIQIFVFFLFSIATIIGFCIVCQKENRKLLKLKKLKMIMISQKWIADTQKHKRKKSNSFEKYSYFLLCFLIPFTVMVGSNVMFFLLVSPIIVWRFYCSIIIIHRKKSLQNIFKLINKLVWIVYHFGFLFLYIVQLLKIDSSKNSLDMIKYIGFILIFCVLIGAIIDILQAAISAIMTFVNFIKIYCQDNKIRPGQQLSETDKKKMEGEELQKTVKSQKKIAKKLKNTEKSQKKSQRICKKGTLKVKFYKKQAQEKDKNKKIIASEASQLKSQQKSRPKSQTKLRVKIKNTKIKNATEKKQMTNKKLKIKQLQ